MSISFDNSTKTFYLDGKGVTYAFFINNFGYAEHLYFGRKIGHDLLLYTREHGHGTCEATTPGGFEQTGFFSLLGLFFFIVFFIYFSRCIMLAF